MNDNVIETRDLSKLYHIGTRERMSFMSSIRHSLSGDCPTREIWALRDINIAVKKGEIIAIFGPNGAGKTTLLKILSGIIAPTCGSFSAASELSCIFELGLGFNPRFTALENVYLYGALHGMSRNEVNAKLPEIIEFSELNAFMGAKLSEFSSGMRARLAFATVIQTIKDIILVDEVLTVGDTSFQTKCIKVFEKLAGSGSTIVFISHNPGELGRLCNKALYIDTGRQVAFGNFKEVEAQYAADIKRKA